MFARLINMIDCPFHIELMEYVSECVRYTDYLSLREEYLVTSLEMSDAVILGGSILR